MYRVILSIQFNVKYQSMMPDYLQVYVHRAERAAPNNVNKMIQSESGKKTVCILGKIPKCSVVIPENDAEDIMKSEPQYRDINERFFSPTLYGGSLLARITLIPSER